MLPLKGELKDLSKRTNHVLLASYIAIASLTAIQIATLFELSLLEDINLGNYSSIEALDLCVENNDLWVGILDIIFGLTLITYVVLFFIWIYQSNSNSHAFTAEKLKHTLGWSVGCFFYSRHEYLEAIPNPCRNLES
ncbi:hypothetical protein [Kiloniella antarctica]|uniref:DNA translocase FtsK 4TM region domain-containing protein n=1 Tax=Kiloniella antarctica TaxID=1550907 RepID=A0ABW5BLW7_9PROT